jgi:hypothetical protein
MAESNLGDDELYDKMTRCLCTRKCPSYSVCAKIREQRFFCMKGKSPTNCVHDEVGCICPECPVGNELGKTRVYYCRYDEGI